MAKQLTITFTKSITISGLPDDLSETEREEIAGRVAEGLELKDDELDYIADDLDLAGTWEVVENTTVGEPTVVEADHG